MCINLCDMKQGDRGRVVGFHKSFLPYQKKLLSMGLTPGTEFTLMRIAPLGDPVESECAAPISACGGIAN